MESLVPVLPVSVGWLLSWVGLYWAYTLLGMEFLAPLLGRVRRVCIAAGLLGLALGAPAAWGGGADGGLGRLAVISGVLVGVLASVYAQRNQWLVPRPAVLLVPSKGGGGGGDGEELVAVLPGGAAVQLSVLRRARTAVTAELLVVHCGLSRSLAVFERPEGAQPAAILPHPSGFTVGVPGQRWDGVDGSALGGGDDLDGLWVGLCSQQAWRQRHPEAPLLVPDAPGAPATAGERKPLVPGARGSDDPRAWGRVWGDGWRALAAEDLQQCPEPQGDRPVRYLSRWAGALRGLGGAGGGG